MDPLVLRRIALEATHFCEEEYKDMPGPIPWVWEKKLAELIVLECIKVCKDKQKCLEDELEVTADDDEFLASMEIHHIALTDVIEDIEEHFGLSLNGLLR